ncbi:MAG: cyclic nucleotide-binding domain-containing protein [Gammaproteobacteria bacterium]|nr:cyclic nucleotide-binding domain-containing protein [Gammaproteobacteria bacterium]
MSSAASNEERQSLQALVPLHTLSDEAFDELFAQVDVESVRKGEMLFNQGDTDHQHVYLVSGRVALLNDRTVVERIEAGSDTARFPLAHQLPRNFSARTESKARVIRIDSRLLSDLLARSQTIDYQVSDFEEATDDDWMSLLLQSRILQQVPASNIQRVMMSVEQVEVEKDEDLIRQGDSGDYYYMLTSGRAVVRRDSGDGKGPKELATLGPGDAFGEEALLSDNPRNSSVTMLNDGMVLRLSKENFLQLIQNPLLEQLSPAAAQAKVDQGAIWLDLRPVSDYDVAHLDGAVNFPFESLRYQASSLSPERHYVVYSSTVARAMAGAFLLTERDFDISVLDAGYEPGMDMQAVAQPTPAVAEVSAEPDVADEASVERIRAAEERARELEAQLKEAQRGQEDAVAERDLHLGQVREAIDQAKRKLVETEEQKREALAAQERAYSDMEQLTGNLEQLQNERASLIERMSEIKGLDKQLQDRLAKAERELIRERELAESASHSLEELTARLNEEIARRDEERQRHALERGELKEDVTALRMDLELANADLEEMREQLSARDTDSVDPSEHQALLQAQEDLQQQLAEAKAEAERDAARLADVEAEHQQAQEALQQLRSEHDLLQAESADRERAANESAGRLQAELEQLRAELTAAQAAVSDAESVAAEAREARDVLRSEHDALQAYIVSGDRDATAALDQAQARVAELESRLADIQAEQAGANTELERLRGQVEESDGERERLSTELEAATSRVAELEQQQADSAAVAQDLEETAAARTAAEDGQRQAEQKATALDEELRAAQARAAELDTRIAQLESKAAGDADAYAALQSQLAEADQKLQALQITLDTERAAMAGESERALTLEAKVAELEQTLAEQQSAAAADGAADADLQAELDELKRRFEERGLALQAAQEQQAELIEALNSASSERESLQLAVSDRDDEQARLVDLENQVADALQRQQRELLKHEQEQHRLQEELEAAGDRRRALEEEVERLTELVEMDDDAAEAALRAEHDALKEQLALRESEVAQLRGVMEEYVEQLQAGSAGEDAGELQALRTELEMVREQAIRDVAQMREQLAAADIQKRRLQQADGREAISHEAMRQKIEALEASLGERQRDLAQAEHAQQMLEDELEDANRKLDAMQRDMDKAQADVEEAMLTRREAETAREQLQQALQELQNGEGVRDQDLRDARLQAVGSPIGIDNVSGGRGWRTLLIGAGFTLAALEATSFATGNGELFSLLLRLGGQ